MRALEVPGSWLLEPTVFPDARGTFHEWYRGAAFREATGYDLTLAQANCSVSRRGVLRGVHFCDVPPGQAKWVSCMRGAILDVVVDLRVGSPTYRGWQAVRLDDGNKRALFLAEGIGHAFLALSDDATVVYLTSTGYAPDREHGVHALDPDLGIAWPDDIEPLLSPKDAEAPTLAEAERAGLLPSYEECAAHYLRLRTGEFSDPA
ncbi:dTDP-4-dehydrorhamnose 3,5-epimerase [Streptomyces sp. NPDC091279]|uniref:dTDP-4-dehydrorhamnose 3,5-epimerase n=1 Tax=unclassified Streptomyces TaxID=2593676 RepID=UPI0038268F19